MKVIKETSEYIIVEWSSGVTNGVRISNTTKERKFLCIGGSRDKQRVAEMQITGQGYAAYNAASRHNPRMMRQRGRQKHSQVYIHESLLS